MVKVYQHGLPWRELGSPLYWDIRNTLEGRFRGKSLTFLAPNTGIAYVSYNDVGDLSKDTGGRTLPLSWKYEWEGKTYKLWASFSKTPPQENVFVVAGMAFSVVAQAPPATVAVVACASSKSNGPKVKAVLDNKLGTTTDNTDNKKESEVESNADAPGALGHADEIRRLQQEIATLQGDNRRLKSQHKEEIATLQADNRLLQSQQKEEIAALQDDNRLLQSQHKEETMQRYKLEGQCDVFKSLASMAHASLAEERSSLAEERANVQKAEANLTDLKNRLAARALLEDFVAHLGSKHTDSVAAHRGGKKTVLNCECSDCSAIFDDAYKTIVKKYKLVSTFSVNTLRRCLTHSYERLSKLVHSSEMVTLRLGGRLGDRQEELCIEAIAGCVGWPIETTSEC
ncbi:hypothetical protein DFS34DRAFT_595887 [Phlyctochytrium arcticum]|nr:hypothetical protein DFS34DRAFT_595887 [Phlyctochytrium arcticum]